MEDVADLLDFESYLEEDKIIYKFTYKKIEITELRMLKTIHKMKQMFKSLKSPKIKNITFLFVIKEFIIPANFSVFKSWSQVFYDNLDIITEKLNFTVVQVDNNKIINTFLWLFKKYYVPIKPLYISTSNTISQNYIHDEEYRKNNTQFEISNMK
uniref:Uncharacterized protein n=1 Tax=Florenciella sp. virus SA2 TaxID=3240092 RepID=A0AB39JFJ3_9VIRU